jgi:serine/threonine protein kinase
MGASAALDKASLASGGTAAMTAQQAEATAQVVGEVLKGRYRLHAVLGHGGMSTVYSARDELLGRDVAIKVFRQGATTQLELQRQASEVSVLASLSHHSLVTLLDAGVEVADPKHPRVYLVMELVKGQDLKEVLKDTELSPRQVAEIGYDLAEGLDYMHQRGVVHRDIKPANVLLVDYGTDNPRVRAKLTDFGIALAADHSRVTNDGSTTGTAAYLSPEQARREEVGPPSDVYSMGLLLLECFTGEVAFPGDLIQSALGRLQHDPEIPGFVPHDWRELLTGMTARDPADRPQAHDLVLALRQLVISESGRHRETDPTLIPNDEAQRMSAVRRYQVLDTPADGTFDRITALAARIFSVPIAIVSVVDHDRIWFKSHHGLAIEQIDRDAGLCASAIMQDEPWILKHASVDPRALTNPLVAGEFGLEFYAGVPLRTRDGHNLGTLCILDFEPRDISEPEVQTLQDLAAMVMNELELRLEGRRNAHSHATLPGVVA